MMAAASTEQTMNEDKVQDALEVWAPTYPRRFGRQQTWADGPESALEVLAEAERGQGNEPYMSTYSFPRGHTKSGNIPRVDTLFIDFDFEGGNYESGSGNVDAWRKDLSQLLVRVRRVADYIETNGAEGWRASLSGHKGVHFFIDFPAIDEDAGDFSHYVAGLNEYATDLVSEMTDGTGLSTLHEYVDVTSSDMGRLCRVPNTLHGTATESFDEERYCVPVTMAELADISVGGYIELTQQPRPVLPDERHPNGSVGEQITNYVQTATTTSSATEYGGTVNWSLINEYRQQSTDGMVLGDVRLLTADRPCVWKWHKRDDKWDYGEQSHIMEVYCVRELLEHNVPIDVIKDFLDSAPGYDEEYSERLIKHIIARDYNRFRVDTMLDRAPEFTGYDDCKRCRRAMQEMQT